MKLQDVIIGAVAVVALVVAGFTAFKKPPTPPVGATPGSEFYQMATFYGGRQDSSQIATSSQGSVTVTANEFKAWANSSMVSFTPGLVAGATVTLPASSTLSSLVPKAGDKQSFCIRNATTTASVYVTLAGGTGTNLLVASSSVSTLGSTKLVTGKIGCLTLIREPATATTYDIDVLLTAFQ